MRLTRTRLRVMVLAGAVCAALLAVASAASAATDTYPGGGSGFDNGVTDGAGPHCLRSGGAALHL